MSQPLPEGCWDTHCHIFPAGFDAAIGKSIPATGASLADYRSLCTRLGISRPVFVQPNGYSLDNSALLHVMAEWDGEASAVAAVGPGTDKAELQRLHDAGVRGARVMDLAGGPVPLIMAREVAEMIRPFGWTMIVQLDGSKILEHERLLASFDVPWVLDHFGKFLRRPPSFLEIDALLRLMDRGCTIKLAALTEASHRMRPRYEDLAELVALLVDHRPDRLIWGSNWPHLNDDIGSKPDDLALAETVLSWIPGANRRQIFVDNPARLFGL